MPKLVRPRLFRCLVIFSIFATVLLLYNIVNISFARRNKYSYRSEIFYQTPQKTLYLDINTFLSDDVPHKIADMQQKDWQQEKNTNHLVDEEYEDPNNKLSIVTFHDPDPGQEFDLEPGTNDDFDEQPDAAEIPDENEDSWKLLPSDELILESDRNKSLLESFIFLQTEIISKKFLSLNLQSDADENERRNILSSVQLSEGGKPIRNLIFTTWGSGWSILEDVVASYPLSFYYFEPLMLKGNVQIGPENVDEAEDALNTITSLLNCDYSQVGNLTNYFKGHPVVHKKNLGLWKFCEKSPELCMDSEFLSGMCQLFPYQTLSLARLRLKLAENLLADDDLDVRVLLLVRDPRGIMTSRQIQSSCGEGSICQDPELLCAGMVEDYNSAQELREKYSDGFLVLRYEDIFLAPDHGFEVLLRYFRLQFGPNIEEVLNLDIIKPSMDPDTMPFQWIDYFKEDSQKLDNLRRIENLCRKSMDLWGYAPSISLDGNMTTDSGFKSVLEPPWPEMKLF